MNEQDVREQLGELKEFLKRLDEQREVVASLVRGDEGWLRLFGSTNGQSVVQFTLPSMDEQRSNRPKGKISLRQAVREIVKGALGEPIHAKEIWLRAQALGAISQAKNPVATIDLTAYSITGMKKVAPRTWAWIGEPTGIEEHDNHDGAEDTDV